MDKNEKIMYEDNLVWIKQIGMKSTKKKTECGICLKEINSGEAMSLLMNNFKLFPNKIVHDECRKSFESDLDLVNWFIDDYKKYKEMIKEPSFQRWAPESE